MIPFEPWWEDLKEIARLYRWLLLVDREPADPAYFIENAEAWSYDYQCMQAACANQTPRLDVPKTALRLVP